MKRSGARVTILVAGATGALGHCVMEEAVKRGYHVRALVHRTPLDSSSNTVDIRKADALDAEQLRGVFDEVELVVSALGASVLPDFRKGRRSYLKVDTLANRNLLDVARAAGVRKFVYVSVACHHALQTLAYVRAHEHVVKALTTSGMEYVVIRPTGFFSAFGAMLPMALQGRIPLIGDGLAKTNPIHDAELASVCLDAMDGSRTEIELGGPEILTRRQLMEEAFRAVGKPIKSVTLPPMVARLMAYTLYPINPRIAQLIQFVAAVSIRDVVASAHGSMRLREYFADRAELLFSSPESTS